METDRGNLALGANLPVAVLTPTEGSSEKGRQRATALPARHHSQEETESVNRDQ